MSAHGHLNITRDFGLHAWSLTRDITSIPLYRSCYIDPLKRATWALTLDTTVISAAKGGKGACNYSVCPVH